MANWWELDDYAGWDTLGEGEGQQYGLENLDLIHQGFWDIYSQDLGTGTFGQDQAAELVGSQYKDSSKYQQELLIRENFAEEFKDFEIEKGAMSSQLSQSLSGVEHLVGKSGFAGGGTARANLESMTDEYRGRLDIEHGIMKGKQLSATGALYNVRKSFVDKLWEDYSAFQDTDPDYTPDWDLFTQQYVEGNLNINMHPDEQLEDDYWACIQAGGDHATCSGIIPGEDIDTGGEGGTGCPDNGTCPDGYEWTCGAFSLTQDCSPASCCTPLDPDDFVNPFG